MAIVFVHGVANREQDPKYAQRWTRLEAFLRRYIAPTISPQPDKVSITPAYWGEFGAQFAWSGASRPRSPLLGMGAGQAPPAQEQAIALASFPDAVQNAPPSPPAAPASPGVLIPAGPSAGSAAGPARGATARLANLPPAQLSDLAAMLLQDTFADPQQETLALLAADAVAHDPATRPALAACSDARAEIATFTSLVEIRYRSEQAAHAGALVAQGGSDWLNRFQDRLNETWGRVDSAPGFAISRALAELRKPLNDMVTLFVGDVFTYIRRRGDAQAPGQIPTRILETIKVAHASRLAPGEPLVVLTHSMGGQIVYDLVTTFIPGDPSLRDLRIDFWCATASQVGLFEEMKLFLADHSQYNEAGGKQVPFPDRRHLGGWWNVWDHNDFISYTAKQIMAGVDDEPYSSGMSVVDAHGGYLDQPSFFRAFADKLAAAKAQNWWRP